MRITNRLSVMKKVKYVFSSEGRDRNDVKTQTVLDKDGWEYTVTTEIRHRNLTSLYAWSPNFGYVHNLIQQLQANDEYLVPVFLLRAQLVELALKHLLENAPYKPKKGFGKKPIERMTMGEVIAKLRQCNDSHLGGIIEAADQFRELRNEVTHNLANTDKAIQEIEGLIRENLEVAMEIEKKIIFFAGYVEDTLGVGLDQLR